MEEQFKAIQAENYSLRAYIISLQSRLIESQGEDAVPPPPSHLSGAQRVQTLSTSRISEQVFSTSSFIWLYLPELGSQQRCEQPLDRLSCDSQ